MYFRYESNLLKNKQNKNWFSMSYLHILRFHLPSNLKKYCMYIEYSRYLITTTSLNTLDVVK